jgi:hypothetical protein
VGRPETGTPNYSFQRANGASMIAGEMHVKDIDPTIKPSGTGCVECLASGGWWLHLRRCTACGHIGCCDSSPGRHARKHANEDGHPVIASFEPGEDWFYDFRTDKMSAAQPLIPPLSHPIDQPVPGPRGRVPQNWETRLHA